MVAIHKPAGLKVHPAFSNGVHPAFSSGARDDGRTRELTLVDWVLRRYPELKNVGEPFVVGDAKHKAQSVIDRPGIVHRLDKETSGVLLIAKNQETFLYLKNLFKERLVRKTYRAFVHGKVREKEGVIDRPIARSGKDSRLRSADDNKRGKAREALTEYKVLSAGSMYSYVEVYPKTGRTHQIRVHLKFLGYPIICDTLYAPKRECPKTLGRLGLHAYALQFKNEEGVELRLEAPLPEDMKLFLRQEFSDLQDIQ